MAVTRLKRKAKRNKQTASIRRATIKQLTAKPVLRNVDVEEIKAGFAAASKKAVKAKKEETPVAEEATPAKTEKKATTKKSAPKDSVSSEKKVVAKKKPATKKVDAKEEK